MANITTLFLLITITLLSSVATAQEEGVEYNWKKKKDKDGIAIYTSKVPGSRYNAVRGVMLVNGSVSSLVSLVQDTSTCSQWVDLCKEARIHKRISEAEYYVYSYNNIPFPASDRDIIAKALWTQDPISLKTTMSSHPVPELIPRTTAVRIEEAFSQWHFSPRSDGTTLVESFAHINPNGPTPAWLTNRLLVNSPYKTLKNMKSMIEKGSYQPKPLTFIQDLPKK